MYLLIYSESFFDRTTPRFYSILRFSVNLKLRPSKQFLFYDTLSKDTVLIKGILIEMYSTVAVERKLVSLNAGKDFCRPAGIRGQ